MTAFAIRPTLNFFPFKRQIWTYLEDPHSLTQTCKRFLETGRDRYVRYKWLMGFPSHEIIYRAISKRHILDLDLLNLLLKANVPVSRTLVQLVHLSQVYPAVGQMYDTPWARTLPVTAYVAILHHGVKLYGEKTLASPKRSDEALFTRFLMGDLDVKAVRVLIEKYRYMPLPVTMLTEVVANRDRMVFTRYRLGHAAKFRVEAALLAHPNLFPLMRANGEFSASLCVDHCDLTSQNPTQASSLTMRDRFGCADRSSSELKAVQLASFSSCW